MSKFPDRYSLCNWPWASVQQRDLQPQGQPEATVRSRRSLLLGLRIQDAAGRSLGMLGVKCVIETGDRLVPHSLAPIPPEMEDDGA